MRLQRIGVGRGLFSWFQPLSVGENTKDISVDWCKSLCLGMYVLARRGLELEEVEIRGSDAGAGTGKNPQSLLGECEGGVTSVDASISD